MNFEIMFLLMLLFSVYTLSCKLHKKNAKLHIQKCHQLIVYKMSFTKVSYLQFSPKRVCAVANCIEKKAAFNWSFGKKKNQLSINPISLEDLTTKLLVSSQKKVAFFVTKQQKNILPWSYDKKKRKKSIFLCIVCLLIE